MYKSVILPLAKKDIQETALWYNKRSKGLGKRFAAAVREKVRFIRQNPEAGRNIPCAKINNMKDLFEDKQLELRNMLLLVEGETSFKITGNPIKFNKGSEKKSADTPPRLGEHTESVLKNILEYSDEQEFDCQ